MDVALTQVTAAQFGGFVAVVVSALIVLRFVVPVIRSGATLLRRTGHFLDDWIGEPERGGQIARPGVLEQITTLRQEQLRLSSEMQHNSGSTLRDAVRRIEQKSVETDIKMDQLTTLVGGFVGTEQASRLAGHEASAEAWKAIQAAQEAEPPTPED